MDNDVNIYIQTLKKVAGILNENDIKYALAGGVVAELRSGKIKSHKDVDLAVFEEDMPKIKEVFREGKIFCGKKTVQLKESDNWIDTTEHNVIGKDIDTGVDIGFFVFDRQEDQFNDFGDLTSKAGFVRKTDVQYKGKDITLRQRMSDALEEYLFDPDRVEVVDDISVKVQPLPYIIMLKTRNMRDKDREDIVSTTELLTDSEIDEYNNFKNEILSTSYTAQIGEGLEGNCDTVRELIDVAYSLTGP